MGVRTVTRASDRRPDADYVAIGDEQWMLGDQINGADAWNLGIAMDGDPAVIRLEATRERLRLSLWFLPAVFALGAALLALALVALDRALGSDEGSLFFTFGGTAEAARNILSTIAQSMLTFTGLVFTITMLVLQLASTQLSPRVMRTFLRDRANQVVLGLFVATFVFTLLVLREVRTPTDDDGFVPAVSIWVAFALLLVSVGAFIYYIDHMAHAIRASTVITSISSETSAAIDRLYPQSDGDAATERADPIARDQRVARVVEAPRAGVVVGVDEELLLDLVDQRDRRLELVPCVGDFVPRGAPLARLGGDWDDEAVEAATSAVSLAHERTLDQDAAFGVRQLVDIAIRALSPGTNDPSTAVQALDQIHDLLRQLATRPFPAIGRAGVRGEVRLILPRPDWDAYVHLAIDEIRHAGSDQIQVTRRLRSMLTDLLAVASDDRRQVLRQELERLDAVEHHR